MMMQQGENREAAHVEYLKKHDVARRVNDSLIAVLTGKPEDPVASLGAALLRPAHPPGPAQIYAFEGSANSMEVVAAAACMKVPYNFIRTDITKGDHHSEQFSAINAKRKIPALEIPDIGLRLGESNAILRALANVYPVADHWYPSNPVARAKVDYALDWRQTEFYPTLSRWAYYVMDYSNDGAAAVEARRQAIQELDWFLTKVAVPNGGFAGGPMVSIADIAIATPLLFLRADPTFTWPPAWEHYFDAVKSTAGRFEEVLAPLSGYANVMRSKNVNNPDFALK
eukprot:TRINITY_DN32885_c0_g1_i1.p2 TRINITY_DN32885_c0_g1~~TRINITY_DN32885_c0_g1_i1.p2  ORF type:complete len:284 (-),score=58.59 TRINITY_DN32885_c0_g1_i1:869-1720(-)